MRLFRHFVSLAQQLLLLTEIKTEKFAYRYTLVRNWVHSSCILKDCLEVNTIEFYQVSNDCFFLCLASHEGPSDQTMETPMKLWLKNWLPRPFKLLSRIIERSRKVYRISLHDLRRTPKKLAGSFHVVAKYLLWYNFIHGLYFLSLLRDLVMHDNEFNFEKKKKERRFKKRRINLNH